MADGSLRDEFLAIEKLMAFTTEENHLSPEINEWMSAGYCALSDSGIWAAGRKMESMSRQDAFALGYLVLTPAGLEWIKSRISELESELGL